ncbi:MAG: hypothetical protein WD607_01310 [Candidatus Paceibacterota bacterium]
MNEHIDAFLMQETIYEAQIDAFERKSLNQLTNVELKKIFKARVKGN